MTIKQLMNYAGNQLENFNGVTFFANTGRWVRPYAPNGEKYGLCYINTNKLIASANNIDEAKAMIDDYIDYCKEKDTYYKSEAKKYGYAY